MDNNVELLKEKAKKLLGSVSFGIFNGEDEILKILQEIIDNNVQENSVDLLSRTLDNINNYLLTKKKMIIQNDDYEYLRNIAELLRNQKVRINDQAPFSSPIFKVNINEHDKAKNFAFITREGAEKYIEYNSTILNHLPPIDKDAEYNEDVDRRKNHLFDIENNTNLEIEKIIDIIKRNY